ncbi:hypothetical protein FOQG_08774 [Fusarium oxysporum f. sp. raphani 54005]|jgi:hypothetical protein|uniref:Uncharacterized protein n=2 Tax=Fusarium oxysporum TaxID=5507 RepID=X0C191_FUSOX|nr:hypothetical protein FOQG_08774 [Fusarium oxysporum f. sp. raphani 54005]EXL85627.1 hypothetical protein FOPG_02443 [Fusarium oxysporum f. sp. conglutinans race 2 54008]
MTVFIAILVIGHLIYRWSVIRLLVVGLKVSVL